MRGSYLHLSAQGILLEVFLREDIEVIFGLTGTPHTVTLSGECAGIREIPGVSRNGRVGHRSRTPDKNQ
jgi:hypothetical protein